MGPLSPPPSFRGTAVCLGEAAKTLSSVRLALTRGHPCAGQGLYSNVELIEHEEHRLARHAGKVVYETPNVEETRNVHEPRHPTVKDATAAMHKHAVGLYTKGLGEGVVANARRIVRVESIFPTREQIEEFELARTEMQRDVAPEKLQTHQNMFYSPSDSQLRTMLDKSFRYRSREALVIGAIHDARPAATRFRATRWRFARTPSRRCARAFRSPTTC